MAKSISLLLLLLCINGILPPTDAFRLIRPGEALTFLTRLIGIAAEHKRQMALIEKRYPVVAKPLPPKRKPWFVIPPARTTTAAPTTTTTTASLLFSFWQREFIKLKPELQKDFERNPRMTGKIKDEIIHFFLFLSFFQSEDIRINYDND